MEEIFGVETKVQEINWYTKNIFSLLLYSPEICNISKPGQFVMIRDKKWNLDPFLSRPMSIARVDKKSNIFELQILVTGKGTSLLSEIRQNESVYILGPLGNTFTIPENEDKVALLAGGIGIAPLIYFSDLLLEKKISFDFYYGAASEADLIEAIARIKRVLATYH